MSTEKPVVRKRLVMEPNALSVIGEEFVNQKVVGIVEKVLDMDPDIGLVSLIFRNDGYPKVSEGEVLGLAYPDVNAIALNLERIWEVSCYLRSAGYLV